MSKNCAESENYLMIVELHLSLEFVLKWVSPWYILRVLSRYLSFENSEREMRCRYWARYSLVKTFLLRVMLMDMSTFE